MSVANLSGGSTPGPSTVAKPVDKLAEKQIEENRGLPGLDGALVSQNTDRITGGSQSESIQDTSAAVQQSDHPTAILESLRAPMAELEHEHQALEELLKGLEGGALSRLDSETMARFLKLQMGMQKAAMNVELVSKTVEMGTSGAKTLLQTQA